MLRLGQKRHVAWHTWRRYVQWRTSDDPERPADSVACDEAALAARVLLHCSPLQSTNDNGEDTREYLASLYEIAWGAAYDRNNVYMQSSPTSPRNALDRSVMSPDHVCILDLAEGAMDRMENSDMIATCDADLESAYEEKVGKEDKDAREERVLVVLQRTYFAGYLLQCATDNMNRMGWSYTSRGIPLSKAIPYLVFDRARALYNQRQSESDRTIERRASLRALRTEQLSDATQSTATSATESVVDDEEALDTDGQEVDRELLKRLELEALVAKSNERKHIESRKKFRLRRLVSPRSGFSSSNSARWSVGPTRRVSDQQMRARGQSVSESAIERARELPIVLGPRARSDRSIPTQRPNALLVPLPPPSITLTLSTPLYRVTRSPLSEDEEGSSDDDDDDGNMDKRLQRVNAIEHLVRACWELLVKYGPGEDINAFVNEQYTPPKKATAFNRTTGVLALRSLLTSETYRQSPLLRSWLESMARQPVDFTEEQRTLLKCKYSTRHGGYEEHATSTDREQVSRICLILHVISSLSVKHTQLYNTLALQGVDVRKNEQIVMLDTVSARFTEVQAQITQEFMGYDRRGRGLAAPHLRRRTRFNSVATSTPVSGMLRSQSAGDVPTTR